MSTMQHARWTLHARAILFVFALFSAGSLSAGWYGGGALGGSRVVLDGESDRVIALRVHAGYQFNPFFALESGVTDFQRASIRLRPPGVPGPMPSRARVNATSVSLIPTFHYPLWHEWTVFGGVGAAVVRSRIRFSGGTVVVPGRNRTGLEWSLRTGVQWASAGRFSLRGYLEYQGADTARIYSAFLSGSVPF